MLTVFLAMCVVVFFFLFSIWSKANVFNVFLKTVWVLMAVSAAGLLLAELGFIVQM